MLRAALDGGRQLQHAVLVRPAHRAHRDDRWLAGGERAGLVEDDGVHAPGHLERRAAADRARRPAPPVPVPTMTAVGVARPMAQGQAMMSTEMAETSANVRAGSGPSSNQATNVMAARTMTSGTNHSVTRSAMRWMGALEPCASRTMRTIWPRTLSRPTCVARTRNVPLPLMVAPMTASPTVRVTGSGSPVSIDFVDGGRGRS